MNVIVSMISVEGKKVYHRPDCVYGLCEKDRHSVCADTHWLLENFLSEGRSLVSTLPQKYLQ